jgi:tRNA(Ile)-lysidine synthetase-like protein
MPRKTGPAQVERALRQRLLNAFKRDLFVTRHQIIVGFSGGNDSLALALLLKNIEQAINADIVLAHVDHRIRPESGADAKRAQALAQQIGLPFHLLRADDHPVRLHPGVGLEEAARRERFRLLRSLIQEPYDAIALAHHANDQAETMLLHLLRGSGIDGLAGMRRVVRFPFDWDFPLAGDGEGVEPDLLEGGVFPAQDDWIEDDAEGDELGDLLLGMGDEFAEEGEFNYLWRPLIRETRADLEAIVARSGLEPIEDPSNFDLDLRRNAIRHKLIPVIAEIEPDYLDRFGTLAEIAADESEIVELASGPFASRLIAGDGTLNTMGFRQLSGGIARRVVRIWLTERTGEVPTFERVEAVVALAREQMSEGLVEVGGGNVVVSDRWKLHCGPIAEITETVALKEGLLLPPEGSPRTTTIEGDRISVSGSGKLTISVTRVFDVPPDARLSIERVDRKATPPGAKTPFGNNMRDHGIPPWMRDRVYGVAFDGVVHWLPYTRDTQGVISRNGDTPGYQRTITIEAQIEEPTT